MSAQTFRCCPHCADDTPHIEKDTHKVPCTLCYGNVERHTAAIAEAAREYVRCHLACFATGRPYSDDKWDVIAAKVALIAAVEAEREAQSATYPNTQP